ncbi:MAG: prenyltransferase [Kiritimatiellae bacterium]|nr:prenyltransferase [Kiritimatiellia bacterium]
MIRFLRFWLRAVRFYAFSTSFTAVALGGLYARWCGEAFSWGRFAAATAAGMLIHAAANLWNDYFDYTGGVDREPGKCGSAMIFSGELTPRRVFRAACLCAALAAAAGLALAWRLRSPGLVVLGAAGLVGAAGYCAGPRSPKHLALGEVWVFLMMGLGMPLGGWMCQTGTFSVRPLLAALPVAMLTALLLYNNNLRDLDDDRAAGIRTLPMLLGRAAHPAALTAFAAVFVLTALLVATSRLPASSFLTLLALPPSFPWLASVARRCISHREELHLARLHFLFGLLLLAGLLPAPRP